MRTHSAERPLSVCRRTPISGAVRPVRARQTISLPRRSAMAAPVAPVRVCAFSAMMLMPGSRSISPALNQTRAAQGPAHMMMARPRTIASGESCRRGKFELIFGRVVIFAGRRNLGNRVEQRPHQPVQFRIRDKMRRLLPAKRSAEHPRKTQHRATAAGQTLRRVVFAEQFTLHAKYCRLQATRNSHRWPSTNAAFR